MERLSYFTNSVNRIVWRCSRLIRLFGAASYITCSLLLLTGVFYAIKTKQDQRLVVSNALIKQVANKSDNLVVDRSVDPEIQLQKFEGVLPKHQDILHLVKKLLLLAEDENLDLKTGDYKAQNISDVSYMRYMISLPLRGNYNSIQRFILKSLKQLPTLTVESVVFNRDTIADENVDAHLQLVLFAHSKPGVADEGVAE